MKQFGIKLKRGHASRSISEMYMVIIEKCLKSEIEMYAKKDKIWKTNAL